MAYGIVLEFDDSVGKQQCRRLRVLDVDITGFNAP